MWPTKSKTRYSLLIMLADVFIINLGIISAFLIRFRLDLPIFNFEPYLELCLWISAGSIFILNMYQLYSISARTRWDDQFYSIIFAVVLILMFSISLTYISANYSFPRLVFLLSSLLQAVFLLLWRYLLWRITKKALGVQNAVLMGGHSDITEMANRIREFSDSHISIIGLLTNEPVTEDEELCEFRVLGEASGFATILETVEYDVIVVTPSVDVHLKEKIVCHCYTIGKEVFLIPDLYEVLLLRAELNILDDIPIFAVRDYNSNNTQMKRALDVILGCIAFIFTIPVMAVIALLIKLDSPGPVIYKQERVTKGGKLFILYKFRTMIQDAEAGTGPVFAAEKDQRATRVGRILRLSRLDELPQFVNVIKGDMSLVGPRPERPFFVEQFEKEITGYENRHRMKPGITGIAQIAGKYDTGPREKLVFDLLYAKRNNILVDLQIMLHTLKVLFMRNKAS